MSGAMSKVANIRDPSLDALFEVSLEISRQRDETERVIRELLSHFTDKDDQEALRLMRLHLNVQRPRPRRIK